MPPDVSDVAGYDSRMMLAVALRCALRFEWLS